LTTTERPTAAPEELNEKRWWILAVLCSSLVIVVVGNTVLNVALPTLVRELEATQTELQWIVDSYALVFAGLLLTAGALGDRYGRKGALTIGLVIFGVASGFSAFADGPTRLIVGRAVMGVGAALIMPATLSILMVVFPPHERGKAIAIWAGLAGAGAAIGPVGSGFLLEHFWWGSVFLMNLPIIAGALVAGAILLPKSKNPDDAPLDPVGAALSILGLTRCSTASSRRPTTAGRLRRPSRRSRRPSLLLVVFGLVGAAVTRADAAAALVPQPGVQHRERRHHAGVLRDVRHVLPLHAVPAAGAGLRHPRGRASGCCRWRP
jgi:MFS family permease